MLSSTTRSIAPIAPTNKPVCVACAARFHCASISSSCCWDCCCAVHSKHRAARITRTHTLTHVQKLSRPTFAACACNCHAPADCTHTDTSCGTYSRLVSLYVHGIVCWEIVVSCMLSVCCKNHVRLSKYAQKRQAYTHLGCMYKILHIMRTVRAQAHFVQQQFLRNFIACTSRSYIHVVHLAQKTLPTSAAPAPDNTTIGSGTHSLVGSGTKRGREPRSHTKCSAHAGTRCTRAAYARWFTRKLWVHSLTQLGPSRLPELVAAIVVVGS